jgi:putative two-component system response regulator
VKAVRALLVEDNPGDARLIAEMLSDVDSNVELERCTTLASAIERLASNSIEVVVLDLSLPDSQGIDTFVRLQEAAPRVAVIVLTGNSDTREAIRTVEEGAQDFLVKGRVDGEILTRSIDYAHSRKDAELQLRASQAQLRESNAQLIEMVYEVAEAMGRVVEARDPYTQGHQERVARVAKAIAEEMGLPKDDVDAVEMAGLVHDIGKMCIPAEILSRPGQLTEIERSLIRQHPQSSYDILKRLDGSGYPLGLTGDEILLAARILSAADVVEAMSSHRPYRPALGLDLAIVELTEHPELYDSVVADSCKRLYEAGKLDL